MSSSPKRDSDSPVHEDINGTSKRLRLDSQDAAASAHEAATAEPVNETSRGTAPDSLIDHAKAIEYWSSTEASVNGMLGGFPQVSRVDLQGSANFLAKLRRQSKHFPPGRKLSRAVDCGAGIGRVATGFLGKVAHVVDVVEPVQQFTEQIASDALGEIFNVGLEAWIPNAKYDLIWTQWCAGQLTDAQLVAYLARVQTALNEGGWIVVKENLSNHPEGVDVFDETDSSVTRTDGKFRSLFEGAGLKLVSTELQKGFPKGLYPVRTYALQLKRKDGGIVQDRAEKED